MLKPLLSIRKPLRQAQRTAFGLAWTLPESREKLEAKRAARQTRALLLGGDTR